MASIRLSATRLTVSLTPPDPNERKHGKVELAAGSLAQERFHGYILQDAIYLGGPHPDDCRCPGSR